MHSNRASLWNKRSMNSDQVEAEVDAVYTDLSRAFDSVNHCLLLLSLKVFPIISGYLQWIVSFIICRQKFLRFCLTSINIKNTRSEISHVLILKVMMNNVHIYVHVHCRILQFRFGHCMFDWRSALVVQFGIL